MMIHRGDVINQIMQNTGFGLGRTRVAKEYILYCDESDGKGKYFSNFYGGVILSSDKYEKINKQLLAVKKEQNLLSEVKWQKVTANYLDKYITLIDKFFEFIALGDIKVRIMFTKNSHVPQGLDNYQRDNKYFLLYYQFIKHAFGFTWVPAEECTGFSIRAYLDKLPDTKEKVALFKDSLHSLEKNPQLRKRRIKLPKDQMAEIDSKEHVILQGLDVILGSIQFRLNDKHLEKPEGQYRRGKRTIAKEKLYKHINKKICEQYRNFNIGVSTSIRGNNENRWADPYRHWLFIPSNHKVDATKGKKNKK